MVSEGNGHWSISPAQPVAQVPLRWEYSFGGLNEPRNPLGRGIDPLSDEKGPACIPLPQIEYPDDGFHKYGDRPRPANFAPVPPRFTERRSKLGTRDQHWANFRAPLPPKDYDPSVHNAAPGDQQAKGYPRGNEALSLRNLHPRFPEFNTRLPGLRVRAGILRTQPEGKAVGDMKAEEVRMRLDTIVILPDEDELVLLWRGVVTLHGRKETEILLLQAEIERVEDEPAPSNRSLHACGKPIGRPCRRNRSRGKLPIFPGKWRKCASFSPKSICRRRFVTLSRTKPIQKPSSTRFRRMSPK